MKHLLYLLLLLSPSTVAGTADVIRWNQMVTDSYSLSEADKVARVNTFFNKTIEFKDDIDVWGVQDFWATHRETLLKGAGDCEDFAIAKYMTLKLLGVNVNNMRLAIVRIQIGGPLSSIKQSHMVLNYRSPNSTDPLVLDNVINSIYPQSKRTDLYHIVEFNHLGIWVDDKLLGKATLLPKWTHLLQRMETEK